jgi:hypothetical protein
MRNFKLRSRMAAGLVIGAVALTTLAVLVGVGSAASAAAPRNTSPPTVTGTANVGSALTANRGTWTGTDPITYRYQWQRCDENGGSCSNIGGATDNTYTLKNPDAGNTLRVRVTATNTDGSASATSVPTAVVKSTPTPPATGCPSGSGVIAIADLGPPARLVVDQLQVTPTPVGRSTTQLTTRFHVTACGNRPVQGALVYVTAVPFSQFSIPAETPTGADGWVSMNMDKLAGFPAARNQQLLVFFTRARKSGENALGGVSTRRLVSVRVDLSR